MPAREDWSSGDHDRLWEHLNTVGRSINDGDKRPKWRGVWDADQDILVRNGYYYAPKFIQHPTLSNMPGISRQDRVLVVPTDGSYDLKAVFCWYPEGGVRRALIIIDPPANTSPDTTANPAGSRIADHAVYGGPDGGTVGTSSTVDVEVDLRAGQRVMFCCWQSSGVSLRMNQESYLTYAQITRTGGRS